MSLDESTKAQIEDIAMKYAKQGRPERDVPHVRAVAFYMQNLSTERVERKRFCCQRRIYRILATLAYLMRVMTIRIT